MILTCVNGEMPADVHDLYLASFPEQERRQWRPRPRGSYGPHLHVARHSDGSLIGFMTTWRLPGATYIEHLAIDPALRSRGYGARFLSAIDDPVILEVEPPDTDVARRRIRFYERHGFAAHPDFDYVQPPYAASLPPVPLMLMTRGHVELSRAVAALRNIVYRATHNQ